MLFDDSLPGGELQVDAVALLDQPLALALDLEQPRLDLPLVEGAVGGQVEQVLLLDVQAVDLLVELGLEQPLGGFLVGDGVVHGLADQLDELVRDVPALVVALDGFFDSADVVEGLAAGAVLAAGAEEVVVLTAVASDAVLHQQPLVDAALPLALGAVDGALEEVMVDPSPLTGVAARLDDLLNPLEQVVIDERRMLAGVVLALELDDADVVAVLEHPLELAGRNRSGRALGGGPGQQAAVRELVGQVGERVLAGGV